ncbi:type IV toxin-antitoxin system AbiEi family antitoxin domain-containing protein [Micromonospora chokoriensis]|uniref:type IV toxin-antitoxin system AbiEi family antitoxin domain-containing protein n=1 Tax=Micromonospora chokoriensis TaxID=356851 RepID=UPI0004C3799A|nr:type IV toxin-antitoxin system AbiEi family antitoxin domain-containing protein [Micromonospora chokoriensis]
MAKPLYQYSELIAAGLSREQVRRLAEQSRLHRMSRSVYAPSADQAGRLPAIFRRLPATAVAGFYTGAHLHGFGDSGSPDVHVIVPAGERVPHIRGVITHEAVLPVRDPVLLAGVPCAPAARCAVDLARAMPRMEALPLLDLCLRVGACEPEELRVEVARHDSLRGVCQARDLVPRADPRAECRQESQLRLVLMDGGLPPPEPQIWVLDSSGTPLYRLDLGYRQRRVGVEYDGSSHLDRARLRRDRSRMNWLAANGWQMRYFTDLDLYRRPAHIIKTLIPLLRP